MKAAEEMAKDTAKETAEEMGKNRAEETPGKAADSGQTVLPLWEFSFVYATFPFFP